MLLVVAALAVPRTPDAPAALAEPEARDAHELERGLFDPECKDRIKPYMHVDDAMDACSKGKKCAFCAVKVEILGGEYVSKRNKKPLQGKEIHRLLGSDKSWMYRCTSHPKDWHGFLNRIPPRCAGAELGKSSKDKTYQPGPGWYVAIRNADAVGWPPAEGGPWRYSLLEKKWVLRSTPVPPPNALLPSGWEFW